MLKNYIKILFVITLFFTFYMSISFAVENPALSNLRYSFGNDNVRLVFEATGKFNFTIARQSEPEVFTVNFTGVKIKKELKKQFKFEDHLIDTVTFSEKDGNVKAQIKLKYRIPSDKFKAFVVENPDRLVFDFGRIFEEKSTTYLSKGIVWSHIIKGGPTGLVIINLVEIDLANKDISLKAIEALDNNHSRETTSSMARRSSALVAINGGFFANSGGPLGLVLIDGKIEGLPVSYRPPRSAFGITADKKVLMDRVTVKNGKLKSLSGEDWSGAIYALAAGPTLISDGKINITATEEKLGPGGNNVAKRCAHTVMGMTKNNKIVLFTVDGRKLSESRAMDLEQIAQYLIGIGVTEAVCMDGGTSTSMAIQGQRVAYTFIDERKVGNIWAVFTKGILTDPAAISVLKQAYTGFEAGKAKYSLEFLLTDGNGKAVPDGTGVRFNSDFGVVQPSFTKTKGGKVSAVFTSMVPGNANLVVTSGILEGNIPLEFK